MKSVIRRGVPVAFRGEAWLLLSGARALQAEHGEGYYAGLLSAETQRGVDPKVRARVHVCLFAVCVRDPEPRLLWTLSLC